MKYAISFILLTSYCLASPAQYKKPVPPPYNSADHQSPKHATILQQQYVQESTGKYNFGYQTSDGVQREEKAEIKNPGTENEAIVVQGSYTYIGPDGVTYKITYIADENGYRPSGPHIPAL